MIYYYLDIASFFFYTQDSVQEQNMNDEKIKILMKKLEKKMEVIKIIGSYTSGKDEYAL